MTFVELVVLGAAGAAAVMGFALVNIRQAIVVTMSLAAFTMTWNDVRLGSLTVSDLLMLATLGLVVVSPIPIRPVRKLFGRSQRSLSLYAVLLLGGGLVGGVLRRQPDVGLGTGLRFVASVAVIVFLVSALVRRRDDFERYGMWYVLGAAANGLIAITGGDAISGRPIGLTNHPNHLGLAMVLALFVALATLGSPRKRITYVSVGCLVPVVSAMVVSGSRGALLAASMGLISLVLMKRGRAVPWLLGMSFAVVVLTFSLPQTLRTGTSALGRLISPTASEQSATSGRLSFYREAAELIQSSPVVGEGFARALYFHNLPLQILVVGGLAGLAALLVLFRGGLRAVQYAMVPGRPIMERACGAGLIASAIFALLAPNLSDRYLLFFVSMALMACSPHLVSTVDSTQPSKKAGGRAEHLV